ncbi:cytochrome c type biogenesis protein CycH [Salmonella enterica]|nr:cytochrome c type biogenesis protein CycH [Salmonella enterica]
MKKILVCFVGLALTACSANSLNYGAEQVRVMTSEPGKECSYLGISQAARGISLPVAGHPNSNLETGARNDLKNKAYKMGGNTVVLLTQRAGQTGSSWHGSGSSKQTNVTLSGNVYRCPR